MTIFKKISVLILLLIFFSPQIAFATSGWTEYYWNANDSGPMVNVMIPGLDPGFVYYDRSQNGWFLSFMNNGSAAVSIKSPSGVCLASDLCNTYLATLSQLPALKEEEGYTQLRLISNDLTQQTANVETAAAAAGTEPKQSLQEKALSLSSFTPILKVNIGPNPITFQAINCSAGQDCVIPWISQYISVIYQYIVGLAAMLAAIIVMAGGFIWLTSAGSPDRVKQAKELILGALLGLFLALFSYLILYTINPELVANKPLKIKMVTPIDINKMAASKAPAAAVAAAAAGCPDTSQASSGFSALITSYCHPKFDDYASLDDYCCAAEMNCSCPGSGAHDSSKSCPGGRHPCADCNATVEICNHTSAGPAPSSDVVAADYSCFPQGEKICIKDKTYTVGDQGQLIKGAHFDVFNENCADAIAVGGSNVTVTAGACK